MVVAADVTTTTLTDLQENQRLNVERQVISSVDLVGLHLVQPSRSCSRHALSKYQGCDASRHAGDARGDGSGLGLGEAALGYCVRQWQVTVLCL